MGTRWDSLSLMCLCLVTSGISYSPTQAQVVDAVVYGTDTTLDIITWNIQDFPRNNLTISTVVKLINQLEVDIIALQEMDSLEAFANLISQLPRYEGYLAPERSQGLAFIYRADAFSEISFSSILIDKWRALPRAPLKMKLNWNEIPYVLINNHLKCCGDEILNDMDPWDEETRRRDAIELVKGHTDQTHVDVPVIILGDLNDLITDQYPHNVFASLLSDSTHYRFADESVARGPSTGWSYPLWPSHIDHLIISDELFEDLDIASVNTLRIDTLFSDGLQEYLQIVSDHLPVAMRLQPDISTTAYSDAVANEVIGYPNPFETGITFNFSQPSSGYLIIRDLLGREVDHIKFENSTVAYWEADNAAQGIYYVQVYLSNKWISTFPIYRI